jgi:hypothetical protein
MGTRKLILLLGLLGLPCFLRADGFLPVAMVIWPAMIFALIPVVLIEAYVYVKELRISKKRALIGSLISNSVSTLLGYPLSAIIWLYVGFAMLKPLSDKPSAFWESHRVLGFLVGSSVAYGNNPGEIAYGLAAGLVPALLLSVWSERLVLQWYLEKTKPQVIRHVWKAQLYSYAFLVVLTVSLILTVGPEFGVNVFFH